MKAPLFITVILVFNILFAQAQSRYRTMEGHIIMIGEVNEKLILVESHKLFILLDYRTKELSGRLDLKTMNNSNGYLNEYLSDSEEPLLVTFSGIISNDDFISQPHLPITFQWPVNATVNNKSYDIVFNAILKHIPGGEVLACKLSALGNISSAKTGLTDVIPGLSDLIKIQFTQVILRKE